MDALSFLPSFFLSSVLILIPLSDQNLHSFLLRGNKCNGLETLTQCAEWSQFTFQHFLKFDLQSKNYSPSNAESMRDIDPSRCNCCDGMSVYLRQGVTYTAVRLAAVC